MQGPHTQMKGSAGLLPLAGHAARRPAGQGRPGQDLARFRRARARLRTRPATPGSNSPPVSRRDKRVARATAERAQPRPGAEPSRQVGPEGIQSSRISSPDWDLALPIRRHFACLWAPPARPGVALRLGARRPSTRSRGYAGPALPSPPSRAGSGGRHWQLARLAAAAVTTVPVRPCFRGRMGTPTADSDLDSRLGSGRWVVPSLESLAQVRRSFTLGGRLLAPEPTHTLGH